ncbi:MAG: hypothetical protein KatS3mg090_0385 [Patescibacteria group bacterium]|nr:MAG: hypothetical protein KatS3mg090_0385 [Patescibacteria group bacterium]
MEEGLTLEVAILTVTTKGEERNLINRIKASSIHDDIKKELERLIEEHTLKQISNALEAIIRILELPNDIRAHVQVYVENLKIYLSTSRNCRWFL